MWIHTILYLVSKMSSLSQKCCIMTFWTKNLRHKNKLLKISCVLRSSSANMPEVCTLGTSQFYGRIVCRYHEFSFFLWKCYIVYLNRFHKAYIITVNIANILCLPVFRIHTYIILVYVYIEGTYTQRIKDTFNRLYCHKTLFRKMYNGKKQNTKY